MPDRVTNLGLREAFLCQHEDGSSTVAYRVAEITDEMVDRVAIWMAAEFAEDADRDARDYWGGLRENVRDYYRGAARDAINVALGDDVKEAPDA